MEPTDPGLDPVRLQSLPIFSSLSPEECAEIAQRIQERDVEPGRHVMHQGDGGYTFFVIESGTAEVSVDDAVVRQLGPGDFLGEKAILGGGRRTATVTATSPMQVLAMFGLDFRDLETGHPEIAEKVRDAIAQHS